MSLNKANFSCAPMYNQSQNNQVMGYLCSSSKNIENFADATPTPVQIFDLTKVYSKGDIVIRNNKAYIMIDQVGLAGDAWGPPRENNWAPLNYDNNKIYKKDNVVNGSDGKIYKMIDEIGQAGSAWAPPRPNNWAQLG
jgi:hypothetical protein